jgi:O-succinylbenzoic acid--CoA ligase
MPEGRDLLRDAPPPWDAAGDAFLLLNPRLDPAWRGRVLGAVFPDLPGRVWLASSGTGGRLKVIALSRAALATSARAVNDHLGASSADIWLNPLPLFHAGGLAITVRAALAACAWHEAGPWNASAFAARAAATGATLASLVPAQLHDLVAEGLAAPPGLRAVVLGGDALDPDLHRAAAALGWPVRPSYGLTETASQVATAERGAAPGAPLPLLPHVRARVGEDGLLELAGPSLLDGWLLFGADCPPRWEDPKRDGWLRTGDRATLDGNLLRVLGRADDLVKVRGELVDLPALTRALQSRIPQGRVLVTAVDDARNGRSLVVVADDPAAVSAARAALDVFPPYARPAAVTLGEIRTTPLGKIIRPQTPPASHP